MFDPVEFSLRLRQERARTGKNQTDFGRLGGVGLQTQSRYEKAETSPNVEYLATLSAAGIDVGFLLSGNRSESAPLSPDANQALALFLGMPAPMQKTAIAVLRALQGECDESETDRTLHQPKTNYRAE